MSLHALRIGQHVRIDAEMFRILQRLPGARWQLQNAATGEWCTFEDDDLLDRFSRKELSFVVAAPALKLTPKDAQEKWANVSIYDKPPMGRRLSGLGLEYQILEIQSRDSGQRSALLQFDVGQTSRDVGYRSEILVLFNAQPAHAITLRIYDSNGQPSVASLVVKDRYNRIYPNPSKRLAPDFPFQPQVYRFDGETLRLPEGYYTIAYTGGPEYLLHTKEIAVKGSEPAEIVLTLDRWIDPSKLGWYSGDQHVHAAGCSHYQNPTRSEEHTSEIQ